jgi:hypothetical protein
MDNASKSFADPASMAAYHFFGNRVEGIAAKGGITH